MGKKVLVAISGGVDSAVAAALLRDAGFDVTAVYLCLRMGAAYGGNERSCCRPQDAADAKAIADKLGVRFVTLSAREEFEPIIKDFVEGYENGRTPNPCIRCNEKIKFGRLLGLADMLEADFVATGHYARIINPSTMLGAGYQGQPAIAPAKAPGKDQSYVLFRLPREKLSRILFPIGELENKQAVRNIAKGIGLEVHDKPDSQDICFVPEGDYVKLLEAHNSRALRAGNIEDSSGKIVGKHDGYGRFTIGQRRGTGVAAGSPVYVTNINPQTAVVTIGTKKDLLADRLIADCANWQVDVPLLRYATKGRPASFEAKVKIRYNHRGAAAKVVITGKDTFEVRFDKPLEAITPGQAAAVYSEQCLLGGGFIKTVVR
jgi:tRNA-specific 2-thiouridylase